MALKIVSNFPERLREALKDTQANILAEKIGLSKQAISMYISGKRNPKRPTIEAISRALNVNPAWLLGYDVPKILEPKLPSNAIPVGQMVNIPIVGRVAAGRGCYAEEDVEGYEPVSQDWLLPGERYIFLRVKGDSMCPKFIENDLLLVQCQTSVDSGSIAVVTIDEEDGVVKKVNYGPNWIEMVSENPYYPPRRFEGAEVLRIKVVGLVKKMIREA